MASFVPLDGSSTDGTTRARDHCHDAELLHSMLAARQHQAPMETIEIARDVRSMPRMTVAWEARTAAADAASNEDFAD